MNDKKLESKKRRVALLGAGYIADFHARAVRAIHGAELVAVCDLSRSRADAIARAHAIPTVYTVSSEMLRLERPDVVHVLLPPNAHARATLEALSAGAHVLVEKPMATSIEECETMSAAARRANRKLGASHNFLFSPPYEELRRDLAEGRIGAIDRLVVTWNKYLPQVRSGPFDAWMLRAPRNVLLETCPHSFAHLVDLVGDPEHVEVRASGEVELPNGGRFYRHWRVVAEHRGAAIDLGFSFAEGYPEHTVHVRGTLASASVDFERNTYTLRRHRPLSLDLDRFASSSAEAVSEVSQAARTLTDWARSKAHLSKYGAPFQASITRSVEAFYGELDGSALDRRLSPELSTDVVRIAKRVGQASRVPYSIERGVNTAASPSAAPGRPGAPKVLVTGGTGFIGRELVRQLLDGGHAVRVVTRSEASVPAELGAKGAEIAAGSLGDGAFVEKVMRGVTAVVHLARSYGTTWEELRESDVEGTRRLAEAAAAANVRRFVYTSSIAVYYLGEGAGTVTEETPPDPAVFRSQPYARAKVETERLLSAMHRDRAFPVVVVRPGIVVGPGGDPCHWGVAMWPFRGVAETWGEGDNPLPFVLVRDVADALVRCVDTDGIDGESFNLVGETALSARDYLDEMEHGARIRLDRRATPIWRYYATDVFKWLVKTAVRHPNRTLPSYRAWEARRASARFDCSKAKSILGWRPTSDRDLVVSEGIHRPALEFFGQAESLPSAMDGIR
jgi:nucleoside-diphosphate-sugar epimerase/predicted dehydrogenase